MRNDAAAAGEPAIFADQHSGGAVAPELVLLSGGGRRAAQDGAQQLRGGALVVFPVRSPRPRPMGENGGHGRPSLGVAMTRWISRSARWPLTTCSLGACTCHCVSW